MWREGGKIEEEFREEGLGEKEWREDFLQW